ncbi:MAG TPA: glycosyltransferase family protein [Chthoniobacter sp.]|nr:glycosyltransferase family protein [Chthoniobacter sp.]
MTGHLLFIINGLGMGNSTRCHAIIEHLAERGLQVHVLTSGNGLTFFDGRHEVASLTPTQALTYSGNQGRISGWKTMGSLDTLLRLNRTKERDVESFLQRQAVDVVVTDSEYSAAPAHRRGIPVLGLNNSDVVVTEYLRRRGKPAAIRSQFWCFEFMDYLFHRQRCDLVVSPSPMQGRLRHARIRRVGLIVRRAVRELAAAGRCDFPLPRELKRVVFMLSGSTFASEISFGQGDFPFHIDVVGRSGDNIGNVTFHGRLMDNARFLAQADALVINGGFSAVSEALALNKPTFVIPLQNHAEQYVNAHLVRDLGRGYVVRAEEVIDKLLQLHAANRWDDLKPATPLLGIDGARESAEIICEMAERHAHAHHGVAPVQV